MEYLQQMLAVLAVFGVLGGALWGLRQRGFAFRYPIIIKEDPGESFLQVERLPLSTTHSVYLVRLVDRAILIGSWPGGCQAIERSPWNQLARPDAGDVR